MKDAIGEAELALVSIPPSENGDAVLTAFGDALLHARRLRSIVYLSTVGVYGDHGGAWVDEETPPQPVRRAAANALAAEQAGRNSARAPAPRSPSCGLPAFTDPAGMRWCKSRAARRGASSKPARSSIASMSPTLRKPIDAAFARKASGIFNVADDEPSPPGDPIAFAAQLLGRDPPPEITFAEAAPSMSPMALSFWQDCRRVQNDKLKHQLGVTLLYPTYREGLRALSAGFSA